MIYSNNSYFSFDVFFLSFGHAMIKNKQDNKFGGCCEVLFCVLSVLIFFMFNITYYLQERQINSVIKPNDIDIWGIYDIK